MSVLTPVRASRSSSAAEACGARPITVPPAFRQAAASTPITVVFPVPAGANARCTRRPPVATSATICACAVFRVRPPLLADHSSIASSTSAVGGAFPVGPAGGGDDPPLGVQHRPWW